MDDAVRQMRQLFKQDRALENDLEAARLAAEMLSAAGKDSTQMLERSGLFYEAANLLLEKKPDGYEKRVLSDTVLALLGEDERRSELYSMLFQGILLIGDASLLPVVAVRFPDEAVYLKELIRVLSKAADLLLPVSGGLQQQAELLAKQFPAGLPEPEGTQNGEIFSYDQATGSGEIGWGMFSCTFNLAMIPSATLRSYLKSLHTRDLDRYPIPVLIQTCSGVPVSLREDEAREKLTPEQIKGSIFALMWASEEGQIRTQDGETFRFRYADLREPLRSCIQKMMISDLSGQEIAVTFQVEQGWAVGVEKSAAVKRTVAVEQTTAAKQSAAVKQPIVVEQPSAAKQPATSKQTEQTPEARFQEIKVTLGNGADKSRFWNALQELPELLDTPICGQVLDRYLQTAVAQYKLDGSMEWLEKAAQLYRQYQDRYPADQKSLRTLVSFAGRLGDTELILSSVSQLMDTQTRMQEEGTVANDITMCAKLCQTQYAQSGDARLLERCIACLDTMKACLPRREWPRLNGYRIFTLVETGDMEGALALQQESESRNDPLILDAAVAQKLDSYRAQQKQEPEKEPAQEAEPESETGMTSEPEQKPEPETATAPEPEQAPSPRKPSQREQRPAPVRERTHNPLPELPVRTDKIELNNGIFKGIDCPGKDGDPKAVGTVWQLIAKGSAPSALLYAKSLTRGAPEVWQPVYDVLAYAYGDPLLNEDYRFAKLQTVYDAAVPGCSEEAMRRFELCALLRMLFTDRIDENILYSVNEDMIRKALGSCGLYQEADALPGLFRELCGFIRDFRQGFGQQASGKTKSLAEIRQQKDKVLKRTRELAEMRLDTTAARNARLNELRKQLFGRDGFMQKLIRIAAEDRTDARDEGMQFCAQFWKSQSQPYTIDEKALNQYIDKLWDGTSALTVSKKTEHLLGAQRQSIFMKVKEYLQTYQQWDELSQMKDTEPNPYLVVRNRLLQQAEQAQRQIETREREKTLDEYAALLAVTETLKDIVSLLHGGKDNRQYFYRDFLTSHHVELDVATTLPMLDESVSILPRVRAVEPCPAP
ncbi:MAG: hypothetical protein LUF84_01880 [Clostridiales bacterium]|nr:hypothetical protein [Clostridiales bacterium]